MRRRAFVGSAMQGLLDREDVDLDALPVTKGKAPRGLGAGM
jgi:hypothetical protein